MYDHHADPSYAVIKESTFAGLDLYGQRHVPPGGFLEAVLSNDLFDAFGRADVDNARAMHAIVRYVYNELPSACHGSPERYKEWLRLCGS